MKVFLFWLRSRRRTLRAFLLCTAVCLLIFYLYRLPLAAVGYAASVCLFFLAIDVFFDYRSFARKHRLLLSLKQTILLSEEQLPECHDMLESDYQALIHELAGTVRRNSDEDSRHFTELIEYYTLWAHQIKTPISAMSLILQDEGSLPREELKDELRRIEQYVEMVLCYLRLDSGSSDYLIREYPLDGIIRQAVRHYASQFIRKKIRLEYRPILYPVLTDEKWFLFVLEQLLSNALKYTRSGGVITIAMDEPGILCIRDTGIGIAAEDLPRIFEKGFTGCNGRTDKKASGIGLYLCRRICKSLGHGIRAESRTGIGTAVFLSVGKAALEVE